MGEEILTKSKSLWKCTLDSPYTLINIALHTEMR